MPTSMPQTPMRWPSNLPVMALHSAYRLRTPTTVSAASKFATLTATSCSSADRVHGGVAFPSVIENNSFRGERGTAGEPGYLVIDGKIKEDGSAKLLANGIVASRRYARGVFARKGGEYSYNIKAHFKGTEGTGTRDEGLGIVGRPCTFEFVKQSADAVGGR